MVIWRKKQHLWKFSRRGGGTQQGGRSTNFDILLFSSRQVYGQWLHAKCLNIGDKRRHQFWYKLVYGCCVEILGLMWSIFCYSLILYLQSRWRGHRDFAYYRKLIRASIVTQCRWRGRVAKQELRKLKMVGLCVVNMH